MHLGLDLGTSSLKAMLVDGSGRVVGTARAGYDVRTPAPGAAECDPADWWHATGAAVREVVAAHDAEVSSVGLSGQMHGVVLCDAGGSPVRPAQTWADARSGEVLDLFTRLDAGALARLANPVVAGMAGPTLAWLARHEPRAVAAACWALQPKDWLRLRLTGEVAAEPTDGTGTLLWDTTADTWDLEVAEAVGIPTTLLAPVAEPTEVAGGLTAEAAAHLGLPAGVPVALGLADAAAACLGTGLDRPGSAQLTIGTGAQVLTPLASRAPGAASTHLLRSVRRDGWLAMAATLNAGLALGWVTRTLGATWADLYATAEAPVDPGTPVFVPHLTGERTPYLDSGLRATWAGLGLGHDRTDLLRAALEGVAFSLRDALAELPATTGPLRLAGGGSTHPAWRRLLADVLGRDLVEVDAADASARGAALVGAVAAGALSLDDAFGSAPDEGTLIEARADQRLEERFARYREAVGR